MKNTRRDTQNLSDEEQSNRLSGFERDAAPKEGETDPFEEARARGEWASYSVNAARVAQGVTPLPTLWEWLKARNATR